MSDRKRYLLRVDPKIYAVLEKWAADDLRSVNAQIEFLLKDAIRRAGRSRPADGRDGVEDRPGAEPPAPTRTAEVPED